MNQYYWGQYFYILTFGLQIADRSMFTPPLPLISLDKTKACYNVMAKFWFRYCTVPVYHMKWPQPSVFKQLFNSICNVSGATGLYRNICNTVGMATKEPRFGAKLWKATVSFVISVLPRGTTRLPLDVFLRNSVFQYFPKFCRKNSGFIKTWQE
jgi:hypothetical protein